MSDREFSLYDIEQFLREAGAEKVTEDAVLNLEKELAKLADKVTGKAMRYAAHAGRKRLIKKEDILLTRNMKQAHLYGNHPYKDHTYITPNTLRRRPRITNTASKVHR